MRPVPRGIGLRCGGAPACVAIGPRSAEGGHVLDKLASLSQVCFY
jgi:hypothetical protein